MVNNLFGSLPGGQSQFLADTWHRYCAYVGGWGAGKSYAGSRKTAKLHLHNAYDADGKKTGVASLVVAPTYQLAKTINIPQMRSAFDAMNIPHRFVGDQKVFAFLLPTLGTPSEPSFVFVRSADAAEAIAGFEVGAVWGDEAARWPFSREDEDPLGDALLQSDGRLRHPKARIYQMNLTYTPEGEDTRVFRDFEEKPKRDHVLYRSSTRANIHLPPEYVASQLEQLSPDLAGQYVDGIAAKLGANLIYGNFDFARNVKPVGLVDGLPLQMGIDFNKTPGMHACVGQHFPAEDRVTTRRVIHRKGMLILQMVQEFDALYGEAIRKGRYPAVELFGDPSGNTGSMKDGETYWDVIREELRARNIRFRTLVPSAHPGVADRANSTNSAFCSASGKVRYTIHPEDCDPLIRDFRSMKWDKNKMDKTDKDRSHACLVSGTLVLTRRGEVPIESVVVGDEAWTRKGWRRVSHSWMSSPDAEVMEMETESGRRLVGTWNHPVWVENSGFVLMRSLTAGMSSVGIGSARERVARVSSGPIGRAAVYDLTVEDAHEFYANGILVSNSDADTYRVHMLLPIRRIERTPGQVFTLPSR